MNKWHLNKGFIARQEGVKMTILDSEESYLYTLNETSVFIFKKIKLGKNKAELIQDIIKRYKVDKDQAEEDLDELLSEMIRRKIIIEYRKDKSE